MYRGNFKPSREEIQHIKSSTVPENTRKTIVNWVRILNNWRENVGYSYQIETIQNKQQLEQEMIEFVCGVRQLRNGDEYAPSSLRNAINCLAMYLLDHPLNINKYNLASKQEFRDLWKTLDGKMKQLKKIGKVARHHDPLTREEIQAIFQHEATSISHPQGLQYRIFMWCCLLFAPRGGEHSEMRVSQFIFTQTGGLQFTKFSQKNDQGGIDGNLDSLIIPVPPDPEGLLGPVHDIKLYIERRPANYTCEFLHLKINNHSKAIIRNEWYCDARLGIPGT